MILCEHYVVAETVLLCKHIAVSCLIAPCVRLDLPRVKPALLRYEFGRECASQSMSHKRCTVEVIASFCVLMNYEKNALRALSNFAVDKNIMPNEDF